MNCLYLLRAISTVKLLINTKWQWPRGLFLVQLHFALYVSNNVGEIHISVSIITCCGTIFAKTAIGHVVPL